MSLQTFLTDAGVAVAVIGLIGVLVKVLVDFHASRPAAEKISVETFADLREQIEKMEQKIIDLRDRVEALELETNEKDRQINALKTAFKALLKWLEDNGVQGYPKPPADILETDPRIKAIRKGGK